MEGTVPPDVAYRQIRHELSSYSQELAKRPGMVVVTKMDLPEAQEGLRLMQEIVDGPVYAISAVTGAGLPKLVGAILRRLQSER